MTAKPRTSQKLLAETREQWRLLSLYERFEQVVAVVLSLIIAVVIAIALVQLTLGVLPHVLSGTVSPLDHEVFQNLCGMVMTLLIALEFKHSIIRVALRRESIVQVKTAWLITVKLRVTPTQPSQRKNAGQMTVFPWSRPTAVSGPKALISTSPTRK